ncbi:MAG: glycogen synthase GlgA [Isosphaera sp.]|nr:glycogen synthase GlgA [Isosphaera sp.]
MAGLRVLLAASEVAGFAKTGGLADVAAALPRALARRGHPTAVAMPYYSAVRRAGVPVEGTGIVLPVPMGTRVLACRVHRSRLPGTDVPVYLIEHQPFFERDDPAAGRGLYQQTMGGGYKSDYPDNAERFVFFSRAVLELVPHLGFTPDVLHANDWQTGLVPVFLAEAYRAKGGYQKTRSVFTIHNIAYQGMFGRDVLGMTGLPGYLFNHAQLEFYGHFNFLKAGVVYADAVNTVSPTYAREIRTAAFGCGLEGLLGGLGGKLSGIVNGCDYDHWDPARDRFLAAPYTAETVFENKPVCKADLQRRFGLPEDPSAPVLGMIARLVSQKGIDLVMSAAPGFLDLGCQVVVLGDGDREFHDQLRAFRDKHPDRVGLHLGFDEGIAHRIEAGADLFLMPSRYEPCGLNQLYSLRYGTPPVVRTTGGLADTVVNATEENLAAGTATGFAFGDYTASALYETVRWALTLYRERPDDFRQVVLTAMAQDWSWDRSAAAYEALYRKVTGA